MENLLEFWYLWLVLIIMIIAVVVFGKKAAFAVRKKYGIINEQEKAFAKYKYLIDTYTDLTKEKINNAPSGEISQGIAAVVQRRLEKSDNFNKEFENITDWQKEIYAYDVLCETVSAGKNLSDFFRENGEPLFSLTFSLLEKIKNTDILNIMKRMYPMLDESNESVSVDNKLIGELDEKFDKTFNINTMDTKIKNYILQNFDK